MTAQTLSIRVLRWTVFFAVSTASMACSGPDFLAAVQGPSDADMGDAGPEAEGFVNCNNCQDPAAAKDAGVDAVVEGSSANAPTPEAASTNATSTDVATSPASNGVASMVDAPADTASTDAIVDATTTSDDSAASVDAGNSAQDSSIDNGVAGDTGMSCGGGTPTPCGALCVDTTSDSSNCGGCGTACTGGKSCVQSACTCPAGTLDCGGTCAPCSAPPSGGVNVCGGSTCTFACTGAGLTKCGSSCADLTSDQNNCGACGHPCQGGSCTGAQCQPFALGTFSGNMALLAINSTTAYAGAGAAGNVSVVEACALSGCSNGASLFTTISFQQFGVLQPSLVATDAGVFWYGATSSAASIGGFVNGALQTYANYNLNTQSLGTIAADSTSIYWVLTKNGTSGSNAIVSCPVGGCTGVPATLETGSTPLFITVASSFLYWTDGTAPSQLMKCPVTGCVGGGPPTPLAASPPSDSWLYPIADSSNVYFTANTGSGSSLTRSILQCGVNGCSSTNSPIKLATHPTPYFAVDSTAVYWQSGSSVVKCAINGCGSSPTTVFSSSTLTSSTPPIAVNATNIYWLNGATLMTIAK